MVSKVSVVYAAKSNGIKNTELEAGFAYLDRKMVISM